LLSIPIASYCSIKRLVFENLFPLKFEPLINLVGIIYLPKAQKQNIKIRAFMKITQFTINNKQKKLTLSFDDNNQFSYHFEYLRVFSPAEAKPKNGSTIPEVFHKKNVQLKAIEPLGKYGHRLVFDDQHSAIFTHNDFLSLYQSHEKNWQQYCDSLTSIQNRETSINFTEVK
jgi:DUF971 family protein